MKKKKELKYDWIYSLGLFVNGFIFIFLLYAISSKSPFGITSIIDFKDAGKWGEVMNISFWYVLIMFVGNSFFKDLKKFMRK